MCLAPMMLYTLKPGGGKVLTFFRILYAAVVFLWEQWRKDEEDVKKGRRPYNFIIALLLMFVAVVVGYNYYIFRSPAHLGQCTVKGSNDEALWVRGQPVVVDYTMVHRINNLTMSTEILLAQVDKLCKSSKDSCGTDVQMVIDRTREENGELDRLIERAFDAGKIPVTPLATTQHKTSPRPAEPK